MENLISKTPEASAWVKHKTTQYSETAIFGRIIAGVIWVDIIGDDGEPIGGSDPTEWITEINNHGWPLFYGHDPGRPIGRTIGAKLFVDPKGVNFVASIMGFYNNERQLRFDDLEIDPYPMPQPPSELKAITGDCWLSISADPREVDFHWLDSLVVDAPLRVEKHELSNNSADIYHELIRIGLVYVSLVWNPFTKTIAQEAGKDVYANIHKWLRNLWKKLIACKNPIVSIDSRQNGCDVSFLFRGNDVGNNYAAHEALSSAADQAAQLIASMRAKQIAPKTLVYEFDQFNLRWFPSYATLQDGRLVSDQNILIAFEKIPQGLSIGIRRE